MVNNQVSLGSPERGAYSYGTAMQPSPLQTVAIRRAAWRLGSFRMCPASISLLFDKTGSHQPCFLGSQPHCLPGLWVWCQPGKKSHSQEWLTRLVPCGHLLAQERTLPSAG